MSVKVNMQISLAYPSVVNQPYFLGEGFYCHLKLLCLPQLHSDSTITYLLYIQPTRLLIQLILPDFFYITPITLYFLIFNSFSLTQVVSFHTCISLSGTPSLLDLVICHHTTNPILPQWFSVLLGKQCSV